MTADWKTREEQRIANWMAPDRADERRQYLDLRMAGHSQPDIAKRMSLSGHARRELGEACRRMGIAPAHLGTFRTDQTTQQIVAMVAAGHRTTAIAQMMGVSETTVLWHLDRAGVSAPGIRVPKAIPQPVPRPTLVRPVEARPVVSAGCCGYPSRRGACSAAKVPGKPRCAEHSKRCYDLAMTGD